MSARDYYHDTVVKALTSEGWTITHDPLTISLGRRNVFVDLGAEKSLIAAEKGTEKIAVEIKSFLGRSDLDQFEDALGQYLIYLKALAKTESDRELYLAVPMYFYERFFDDPFFVEVLQDYSVKLIIFHTTDQKVLQWKK